MEDEEARKKCYERIIFNHIVEDATNSHKKDQKIIVGASVLTYKFDLNKNNLYHNGTITNIHGKKQQEPKSAVFYILEDELQAKSAYMGRTRFNHENILRVVFSGQCQLTGRWILCCESFQQLLSDYLLNKSNIKSKHVHLDEFRRSVCRDVLLALEFLHSNHIFHGNMDKNECYVVARKSPTNATPIVKLSKVYCVSTEITEEKRLSESLKDIEYFKQYLETNVKIDDTEHANKKEEWETFKETFSLVECHKDILYLLRHPLVMTDSERQAAFLSLHDEIHVNELRGVIGSISGYDGWRSTIKNFQTWVKVEHGLLMRECLEKYDIDHPNGPWDALSLFDFIRHFIQHYHQTNAWEQMPVKDKTEFKYELAISHCFPGFIVKCFCVYFQLQKGKSGEHVYTFVHQT